MGNFESAQEKPAAARLMSVEEMDEAAEALISLQRNGFGGMTVDKLVEKLDAEIVLKKGKTDLEDIGSKSPDEIRH